MQTSVILKDHVHDEVTPKMCWRFNLSSVKGARTAACKEPAVNRWHLIEYHHARDSWRASPDPVPTYHAYGWRHRKSSNSAERTWRLKMEICAPSTWSERNAACFLPSKGLREGLGLCEKEAAREIMLSVCALYSSNSGSAKFCKQAGCDVIFNR